MRFLVMHKNDPQTEAGVPPPMELVHKMGEYVGAHAKAGRLVDGAGLSGSKNRTRLTFKNGDAAIKHGPYAGERELPAELHVIKVKTRDEGIAWAERYGKLLVDGEIELGKVNEPWDIGLMPEPPNHPLQMLLIEKEEPRTKSEEQRAALAALEKEMKDAGVLDRSIRLKPSTTAAKRLTFKNNDLSVIDGPFAESKELIGGFAILELPDVETAIEECKRYASILGGTLEVDVRVVE